MNSLDALNFLAATNEITKTLKDIAEALKNIDSRLFVIYRHICMMCDLSKGMIREA